MFIKQCKATDVATLPAYPFVDGYASIKYDGHYCQVHKTDGNVRFFTSGGKEFYNPHMALVISDVFHDDIVLEGEYLGSSAGLFGQRGEAAVITTLRTNFAKGLPSECKDHQLRIFDCIHTGASFGTRTMLLEPLRYVDANVRLAKQVKVNSKAEISEFYNSVVADGYEGIIVKHRDHMYLPGKRVKSAYKVKKRFGINLLCVDYELGTGKYAGIIGALVCMDENGRLVAVGSGMTDADRSKPATEYVGKRIYIEYEHIKETYIQPVFKGVME